MHLLAAGRAFGCGVKAGFESHVSPDRGVGHVLPSGGEGRSIKYEEGEGFTVYLRAVGRAFGCGVLGKVSVRSLLSSPSRGFPSRSHSPIYVKLPTIFPEEPLIDRLFFQPVGCLRRLMSSSI